MIITEGEAAADALASIWPGPVAATVTGASATPSLEVLEALRSRATILWPDGDAAGTQHMQRLGMALLPIASSVRVLDVWGFRRAAMQRITFRRAGVPMSCSRSSRRPATFLPSTACSTGAETLRFRTGWEIARSTPPTIAWRARPYLIDGALLEVVGKVKTAGKTTFVTFMCRAVLDGTAFLGEQTFQGGVVYLTEQPDSSLREALR